jgi:tRNA threonylcarbamoyladenosine biosynthesis protein TsaE
LSGEAAREGTLHQENEQSGQLGGADPTRDTPGTANLNRRVQDTLVNQGVYLDEEETVATAEQMRALGQRLAAVLRAGDLVILTGPLGAGKTTLTQGIGEGLEVRGPITSPTFVIARVHPSLAASGGAALVHADAYRLGSVLELDDLDLDADIATSVTVVEWGEGLVEELAEDRLQVTIAVPPAPVAGSAAEGGAAPRTVRITGVGPRWRAVQLPPADLADRL